MTNEELYDLLDFEQELKGVSIISCQDLNYNGEFVYAQLHYPTGCINVPFVHYKGCDWIFTPCDWQSPLIERAESIGDITWRVNDTEARGLIFFGQPMLPPTAPHFSDNLRKKRKHLGQLLKDAREKIGITTVELAERSGVSRGTISRMEAGRMNCTIDSITAIAQALGVSIDFVLN